jgi:hypothetical protein
MAVASPAQTEVPPQITTPDLVETRLGRLEFADGAPSAATAASQSYPTPAAVADDDGSTTITLGPVAPEGKASNWIQTVPGKGWFAILRLYSPLQPFFDKTWRPSEIVAVP